MGTVIKTILQFTLFSTLVYVLGIIFCGLFFTPRFFENLPYYLSDTSLRLNDKPEETPLDILFIGSSHAYRGFDTRIFKKSGYNTFNLGTSSQTPIQTTYLLKKYMDKFQPKMVIYEVNPEILASDGLESTLDLICNEPLNFEKLQLAITTKNIKAYNTFIYSYFRQIFGLKKLIPPIHTKGDVYIKNGGYVEKVTFDTTNVVKKKISYKIKDVQLNAFKTSIELLNAYDCKTLLIQAPVTKNEYNQYTTVEKTDSIFNSSGTYYNFNTRKNFLSDSLHFYDLHHLNQTGVAIFNQQVISLLKTTPNQL